MRTLRRTDEELTDVSSAEKRESLRVPCDYPVRVYGQMREFAGKMIDVSRTGMAIEIPVARLLGDEEVSLPALAGAVGKLLGDHFLADLHSEMLGPLVRKKLRPVRLGHISSEEGGLEIGCVFYEPLTDDEATMLGIGLPPIGVTNVAAFRDVPAPRRRKSDQEGEPAQPRPEGHQGYLHPGEGFEAQPLVGRTDGVLDNVALLQLNVVDMPEGVGTEIAPLTSFLGDMFGPQPRLEILDGLRMVFAGPVEIQSIEIRGRRAGELLLTLCSVG